MSYKLIATARPPQITGDVDISRFLAASGTRCWRVSIDGVTHFLTDAATAWRIKALADSSGSEVTYEHAYAAYRMVAEEKVESLSEFVAWCQRHGSSLEVLAETPDNHVMRLRRRLLNEAACKCLAVPLSGLFKTPIMVALWVVSLGGGTTLLVRHGVHLFAAHSFFGAVSLALVGVFVHELGHVTACVRYGARQGGIGVGMYWIWPAFFADVRGSWSLPAVQRLRVSLGGLYFQSIYVAILSIIALMTGSVSLVGAVQISLILMATTLNPIFKFDGYWILSDVLNVTNLHKRISAHIQLLTSKKVMRDHSLLLSRWTLICLIFSSAAAAYIGYMVYTMFCAVMAMILVRIPEVWQALLSMNPATPIVERWSTYTDMALIGVQSLVFIVAFVVLGAMALQTMFKFVLLRRGRT